MEYENTGLLACERGAQVRADLVDAILAVEARHLKPADRVAVLEQIAAAHLAERRGEQCDGAAYLIHVANRLTTPAAQSEVLRRCATTFVRPKR